MLSVEEAVSAILKGAAPIGVEAIKLAELPHRIAAEDIKAKLTQPPFAASAMDGYAVRFADMRVGAALKVIGEAPAGAPFDGTVGEGEAVRIFTGGVVPDGADHVVIQENVTRKEAHITINAPEEAPRNIRSAGVDFRNGDIIVRAGERLHEIHGALLAAANVTEAPVSRRPKVAVFSNGDELVEPGAELKTGEIVNSNHYALTAMVQRWGGEAEYLGRASDNEESIGAIFRRARDADLIIPVGGASVGDYDYVKSAFAKEGGEILFEKIAVRPGKPTWHGRLRGARVIGLPGNPASAIVTAALFIQPLVRRFAGEPISGEMRLETAALKTPLPANGSRESYLRAEAVRAANGFAVTPAPNQDSSLLSPFAKANALIRRVADAPAASEGDPVEIVWLR